MTWENPEGIIVVNNVIFQPGGGGRGTELQQNQGSRIRVDDEELRLDLQTLPYLEDWGKKPTN